MKKSGFKITNISFFSDEMGKSFNCCTVNSSQDDHGQIPFVSFLFLNFIQATRRSTLYQNDKSHVSLITFQLS